MRGPGAAIMVSAATSDQQTTEINSELEVQVPLLLEDPLKALEPLLQKVQGWEEVNSREESQHACACKPSATGHGSVGSQTTQAVVPPCHNL